ncbi:2-oxoglutarate-dependent ethylene/succinate-forming enzyme [Corynebacterium occultum]|uniref:2-oxoglutarate-dependent ethylene/succinate-forming enzyme n=1 Tax=Corynebacterium occultum TaxID=2675219 RepID=A0A6B8VUT8_9CORY|nr:2-oxoglutarate and iron-dependent oxygenase domain-containing protein [Corynebacterium occultum]QGU06849.1 2-oxoglutarate-dependent ethylene/succinate-forming enzyme [Corynebacterium occultum]
MSDAALPVISLQKLIDGPGRESEIARLRQVTHEVGFFYLADHGIPEGLATDLFAATRRFFAQPDEVKREISNIHSPHYRGYAHIGDELTQGKVDWREQIDFALELPARADDLQNRPWQVLEGPNLWPESVPELRGLVEKWLELNTQVSRQLLAAWAQSLGQSADFFEQVSQEPFPLMKIARYPGHDGSGSDQGVGAHKDSGVLTLLLPEPGSVGLQVERAGEWIDVAAIPGLFVVNIGELLEVATDGYLVATPHRVLPPEPGTERYSLPYFFTSSLDGVFPRVKLPAELAAAATGVGRDMAGQEISGITGINVLKSRLRAHPEITARYHAALIPA